jgi:uncharacterized damage-inducible protein DinB
MDSYIKEAFWLQFGASIDMLENALTACPDKLWDTDSKFWYIAYHTLFFLDYYLSDVPEEKFLPPPPFTLSEFEDGVMPERTYSKEELLSYLAYCRKKCHNLIADLTAEGAAKPFDNEYRKYSIIEMLIYNLRHVQHHTAQLNLLLRQGIDDAPDWVSRTKVSL